MKKTEWKPRERPEIINPQFRGGRRVRLTRIDLAAWKKTCSERVLRRAFQRGEIRGRRHAGRLYVAV